MTDTRVAIEVVSEGPGSTSLVLAGDIDADADGAFVQAYRDASNAGASDLTLDFHAVEYINSTGIALIVRLLAEARRDRRYVRAVGLSEHYREIFQITRLSDYMKIEDDVPASPVPIEEDQP